MKSKFGSFLMIAGTLLIAVALSLLFYNRRESEQAGNAAQEAVEQLELLLENEGETVRGTEEETVEKPRILPPDEMTVAEIDGYGYIGYVTIPALELELPVMAEWDYTRLKIAPCRYVGSLRTDDLVIAAHNYDRHFGPVRYLEQGTEVYFSDMDGFVYAYEVAYTETVAPNEVEYLTQGDDWELTLFTCTYGGQNRVAVRCRLLGIYKSIGAISNSP